MTQGRQRRKIRLKTYPDRSTEERGGDSVWIRMMVSVVVVAMVMVSGVRTTSCSRLFGLDRHRRAGLSFPLPKPVPVHAESQIFLSISSPLTFQDNRRIIVFDSTLLSLTNHPSTSLICYFELIRALIVGLFAQCWGTLMYALEYLTIFDINRTLPSIFIFQFFYYKRCLLNIT